MTHFENSAAFAAKMDQADPLSGYRKEFNFPQFTKDVIYFTGNSLGLQPKAARAAVLQEMDDWAHWGVEGHFHAKNPWFAYHEFFTKSLAKLVDAQENEVVAMNGLTPNLHFLMVSFYRPTKQRYKILCEAKAFPSDQYALESQVKFHGLNPNEALVEVAPREGEHLIHLEDILSAIEQHKDELALVMIGGVNYYSGQVFDMKTITAAAHKVGAIAGFDLAHAAGNIPLHLHDWDVDFAAWCSYKYLNGGPGAVSGVYIHERHATNPELIRFAGWWGHDKSTRFLMQKGFVPMPSAESWQMCNAPVMNMASLKASLELFDAVGMAALREKSLKLTGYLEFLIHQLSAQGKGGFEIITPSNPEERGCQLSILAKDHGRPLFDKISERGVVADWREPNVIRVAPAPLYNSFEDVYRFAHILSESL